MLGCVAVYVGERIVLVLRDKPAYQGDNGVWLANTPEHHESLRRDLPNLRSIELLEKEITGWQVPPVDAPDFEQASLRAGEFIVVGDCRIGRVPRACRSTSSRARKMMKSRNHR
jgi:hypothetical protein